MELLERIEELKGKLDRAKEKKAQITGSLSELKKSLMDEFGCDSIESAEKKLASFEKKQGILESRLEKNIKEAEDIMESIEE